MTNKTSTTLTARNSKPRFLLLAAPLLLASPLALADNYGCEALLCFAGGKGVSECQPTIKRVLKDLSKGKGFPHCSFVNGDGSSGSGDDFVSTRLFTEQSNKPICRDGVTKGRRSFGRSYTCKTIEIKIKPEYAADKAYQTQYFNY